MFTRKPSKPVVGLAGQTTKWADAATNAAADQFNEMGSRSAEALRKGSRQARAIAQGAADTTVGYVKDEPVKAMLTAAISGAAALALFKRLNRSRDRTA